MGWLNCRAEWATDRRTVLAFARAFPANPSAGGETAALPH
jgi:hypothetical protein